MAAPIYLLFFLSGFPALIYQIVWQRTLFAIYGVNVESVTIVVSAFMLGLGIGSFAGGYLTRNPRVPRLLLFGAVEIGTAAYGIASLPLFHAVANVTAGAPPFQTGLLSFALVLIPTVLMGATLPLLVAHLVNLSGNVGRSVGVLYFVNTLGSACACFVAAWFAMPYLGMSKSVVLAAVLNVAVGGSVLAMHFLWKAAPCTAGEAVAAVPAKTLPMLSFPIAMVLAGVAGFISLCYEIVWYRLYSYASGGPAQCFSYVLGAFLFGIAFGSLLSRGICTASSNVARLARYIAVLVLFSNLLGFAIVPLVALLVQHASFLWSLPLVAAAAGLLGATFPLMCHISIRPDDHAGAGMSYLYLSNIVGSAAGAWLVGFVLMDYFTIRGISILLALLGIAVSLAILRAGALRPAQKMVVGTVAAVICAAVIVSSGPLFDTVYGQMNSQADWGKPGTALQDVVETRSGVVTVDVDNAIFGGGVFDGWVLTDPHMTDTVIQPLSLAFFHPDPKDVLEIGMSGGAWSEIISNHPRVQHQTIVEINPGYVEVVRRHPQVSGFLSNPRVELVIDDGRRWMLAHRDRKFDLIVMDTIYHWRAHATNLLSVEYLNLARSLLKPGGVIYFNTTFSDEAEHTGAVLFPYAYRHALFMAVSETPIQIDKARWRGVLENYSLEGKRMFDLADPEDRKIVDGIIAIADTLPGPTYVSRGMESRENILRRTLGMPMITDDNMVTEWREYNWR